MSDALSGPLSAWPAVEDARIWPSGRPEPMDLERAIYGKVHAAKSDFRWIAASSRAHLEGLAQTVGPGLVHESGRVSAWRVAAGSRLRHAVSLQPSSARDAAGRAGLVDTQVLTWRHPHPAPLATPLHAAWLLQQAASLDAKAAWWEERRHPGWTRRDFMLGAGHVPPPQGPPPAARLHDALADGLEDLQALLREPEHEAAFVRFYAALFARTQDDALERASPAVLFGMPRPLPPAALAALLLPLPTFLAGRLSLLGGELAARNRPEALAESWDVVVAGRETGLAELEEEPLPDELLELAEVVVRCLAEGSAEEVPAVEFDLDLDDETGRRRRGPRPTTPAVAELPPERSPAPATTSASTLLSPEDAAFLTRHLRDRAGHPLLEGLEPEDFMGAVGGLESFEPLAEALQNPRIERLLTGMPGWEAAVGRIFASEHGHKGVALPKGAASALRRARLDPDAGLPLSWLEALLEEGASLERLTLDEALLSAMRARHGDPVAWATHFLQVPCQPGHIRTLLQERMPHAIVELLAFSVDPRAAALEPEALLEPGHRELDFLTDAEDIDEATRLLEVAWKAELKGRPDREPLTEVRDSLRAAAIALLPGEETLEALELPPRHRPRLHPLRFVPWLRRDSLAAWASRWTEAQLRELVEARGQPPRNPRTGAPWPGEQDAQRLYLAANQAERGLGEPASERIPEGGGEGGGAEAMSQPQPQPQPQPQLDAYADDDDDDDDDAPTSPAAEAPPDTSVGGVLQALVRLEASGLERDALQQAGAAWIREHPLPPEVRHRLARLAMILDLLRRGHGS